MNFNLNLKEFIKYLSKFKWLVILIPIICAVVTYFLVKRLPQNYTSQALISTGITIRADRANLLGDDNSSDYTKVNQQFSNLIEMMKSRKVLNKLSLKLILHDLKDSSHAFTEPSKIIQSLTADEKKKAIIEYEKKYLENVSVLLNDNGAIKLYDILTSMSYDEASLNKNLYISRNGESDFIKVAYMSHNPELSVYVVNNLANDFIYYYTSLIMTGQKKSLAILDTILNQKQTEMQRKATELSSSSANVVASAAGAMSAQKRSDILLQQITEAKTQRAQMVRSISSIEAAIDDLNKKLGGTGGYVPQQDAFKDNSEILNIDNQLSEANRRYVNNNFNPRDKVAIDSLTNIKTRLIARSAGNSTGNSVLIKQNLLSQKMRLENDLASAKSMLATIDNQLASLGPEPNISVAPGATIDGSQQIVMQDAQISAREYADAQAQYDQILLTAKAGTKLGLAETGIVGPPEKSKNYLYVGMSGVSSFMICLLTLLLIFMLNRNIDTTEQLANITNQKVLGALNYLSPENRDLRDIWHNNVQNIETVTYKDMLRSLRFELLDTLKNGHNVLGITSVNDEVGKSFLAGSLSYAFALMSKNVLLITDENMTMMNLVSNAKSKGRTDNSTNNNDAPPQEFESFLVKKEIQVEDRITILNRNPENSSLLELRGNANIAAGFEILRNTFDIIIIDLNSAKEIHKLKEWLMYCDNNIAVFESGDKFSETGLAFTKFLSMHPGFMGWVLNKVKMDKSLTKVA